MDRVWPCCGCLLSRVLLAFGVSVGLVWFGLVCSVSVCVSVSIDVVFQASGKSEFSPVRRMRVVSSGVLTSSREVSTHHRQFSSSLAAATAASRLLVGW